jgi:REP element-mobilizing transposase RayT
LGRSRFRRDNADFLLRFAKDRDAYREWLRVGVKRYGVAICGFSITSNHVHIVAHVDDVERIGELMHLVAGAGGQQYNRARERVGRSGRIPVPQVPIGSRSGYDAIEAR